MITNKYNSWKRTEETELDLTELFRSLLKQWKRILVCMLAAGILAGGLKLPGETVKSKEGDDLPETAELTKEELQGVTDAAAVADEIRQMENYLEQSVLMKQDPYHKNKAVMLYSIDKADRQDLQKIVESYVSYISDGAVFADQKKSGSLGGMENWQLKELVTAYQKTDSSPLQTVIKEETDSMKQSEAVFYVEITGADESMTDQLLSDMKHALKQYSDAVRQSAGSHRLKIINSHKSIIADNSLRLWQHEQRVILSSYRENLKNMTNAFSADQMSVYQDEAGLDDASDESKTAEGTAGKYAGFIRYLLLGFAVGIVGYSGIFICLRLFRDTVQSEQEIKNSYTFPFYGRFSSFKEKNRDPVLEEDMISNRIRLVCKKHGITKVCIVTDFVMTDSERECLGRAAARLQNAGIDAVCAENVRKDTSCWDMLADTGALVMVYKIGMTTHRMIDEAMELYTENEILVLGAAAF